MANFTPGPWKAEEWSCHAATTVLSGEIVVAECSGHGRPSADSIADALLISAAPELYSALKAIVGRGCLFVTHHRPDCEWCAGLAALAKAEGRAQ